MGLTSWYHSFPTSPPLDVQAGLRHTQRKATMKNRVFLAACDRAGCDPTPRQARKWNNKQGIARCQK